MQYMQHEALPLSLSLVCVCVCVCVLVCLSIVLWCECSSGQMDEHVPPLLQGAAQSVAVQLASYEERDVLCVSQSHVV